MSLCQLASETIAFPLAHEPPACSRQKGRETGPRNTRRSGRNHGGKTE
jgi:hypothetical protein